MGDCGDRGIERVMDVMMVGGEVEQSGARRTVTRL